MMTSAQVVETSVNVITVLLRTTLTRTIIIYRPMISQIGNSASALVIENEQHIFPTKYGF